MGKAVLPFLGYILLQGVVAIIGLNVIREKELGFSGTLKAWIFGQMLLFAVLQVLAVPMILLRWKFDVLFYSFLGIGILLFGFGCMRLKRIRVKNEIKKETWNWLSLVLLAAALLLILLQSGIYFVGIHLDEDDARFIAQANDVLEYGQLLTRDWDTGEYIGFVDPVRDITSPWPLMYAISARILFTRASIFAHTIFAPIEVLLMYGVYWLIGSELFKKIEVRLTFILTVAVFNLFFAGTVYTQSVFSLVRIWQGKATVAAVIVPLLFYLFIRLNKDNEWNKDNKSNGHIEYNGINGNSERTGWICIIITAIAACLMSGAGIMIALIMIGVYGLYHIIAYQRWKQTLPWIGSLIPPAISLFIYLTIHG